MLKMNNTLLLIAVCKVRLEPDMQVFPTNFLTFWLGVNQMHVVVSLGAIFPIGATF